MSERTQEMLDKFKSLQSDLIKYSVPLTIDEKKEFIQASANIHETIMHYLQVEKHCETCHHCVFWDGQHCCSARDMTPIPFEIKNKVGGCSKWCEKDFIPF